MRLNKKKTQKLWCAANKNTIQLYHHFNYLGSKITEDDRSKADILNRIAQAKRAFQNKKHLLITNSVQVKKNVQKYMCGVLPYMAVKLGQTVRYRKRNLRPSKCGVIVKC